MSRITGHTLKVGEQGLGNQLSKGLSSFCPSCEQSHWECSLPLPVIFLRMLVQQIALEHRASVSLWSRRQICLLTSRVSLQGQGWAALLIASLKDWTFLISWFLSFNTTHCVCKVTWPSLHCLVGTGPQGTSTNDDIPDTMSNKLSFVSDQEFCVFCQHPRSLVG